MAERTRTVEIWMLAALFTAYVLSCLGHYAFPGNWLEHPLGWWGWLDQGNYLKSTIAFAKGDLSASAHWFPLGYSLLGVPFAFAAPNHPYLIPNALCLLVSAALWARICTWFGFSLVVGYLIFATSLLIDWRVFEVFVVPWNTTPVVAFVYGCIYIVLRPERLNWRSAAIAGALAAAVPATRPGDVFVLLPIALGALYRLWREHSAPEAVRIGAAGFAGFIAVIAVAVGLHLAIYGPHESVYMGYSRAIGHELAPIVEKLYAVWVDSRPLYHGGEPIMHRSPWLALVPFGLLVLVWRHGWRAAVLVAIAAINVLAYTAYVQTYPSMVFKYLNIHYFKISFPIFALGAVYGLVAVWKKPILAPAALALALLLLSVRYATNEVQAQVEIADAKTLRLSCPGCPAQRSLKLYPAAITQDQAISASLYTEAGGGRLRSLFDFNADWAADTIVFVFRRPIETTDVKLFFDLPDGHGYRAGPAPRATFANGRFTLGMPRLP